MIRKAIIFGIKGYNLTDDEKKLFKLFNPWGIILFSRNIKNIYQLTKLIKNIKKIFNDVNYPILIDQEGGKVSRLNSIVDLRIFSQKYFADLYTYDKKNFLIRYKIYINTVCDLLKKTGININTAPVLDVRRKKSHNIIGNRSFSKNPKIVSALGKICVKLYHNNKVACVIKHIPGHGLSKSDSHFKTPVINSKLNELNTNDFYVFKNSKSLFAMTAHIIYSKIDKKNTATHSKILINEIIRKKIKFNGILISDDISMKSLRYSVEQNAIRALAAGCNLLLHCNGNFKEMVRLSKVVPKVDIFTQKKTSHFYKFLG